MRDEQSEGARAMPPVNMKAGDVVRVVNLPGCPRANTMGHCHVAHLDGTFAGLVCTSSLRPVSKGGA
jgi:hypothetical protein